MNMFDYPVTIVDTAGFEFESIAKKELDRNMFEQTKMALRNSDLVLF